MFRTPFAPTDPNHHYSSGHGASPAPCSLLAQSTQFPLPQDLMLRVSTAPGGGAPVPVDATVLGACTHNSSQPCLLLLVPCAARCVSH